MRLIALPVRSDECYLMTVRFFLSLLIVCALTVSNGVAWAAVMCQHQDSSSHAAARQSKDSATAAAAAKEESAAISADRKGALAAAAAWLPSVTLPTDSFEFAPQARIVAKAMFADAPRLASRSIGPLLEPPLA